MFSKFFIDRPIFASVLSILIVLCGTLAIRGLPVAMFPEVVPPTVSVSAVYPGADAKTVSETVAAPIEQQLSGTKNLLYFSSSATNDGTLAIKVTFEVGTDLDLAQVDVQNRVNQASSRLPDEVRRQGVTVLKRSNNILLMSALLSDDPRYDQLFLSNYATINLLDRVKRVAGVGDALVYGAGDYAMRVWLDPDRLAAKSLTVSDVQKSIQEQNGLYAAGRIGQRPGGSEVQLTVPVTTRGRLDTPEAFGAIILRSNPDGSSIRLRDVARTELGSQSYDTFSRYQGKPTTYLIVYLQDGANALQVSADVRSALDKAAIDFPQGVRHEVPFDSTIFVEVSIEGVIHTLIEAIILVLVVVYIFLQSLRATLVPLLAVPVAVVGTFAGLLLLGFSINVLTLFGLVLAIGIVVDDAIVVVENVERIMHETGKNVRDATIQAMNEVSGPVIAIVLVLSAVFVPVAFIDGLTGRFYQQFALTIALSVAISGLVALTLSPALCVLLLKPGHGEKAWFFRKFDAGFERLTGGYMGLTRWLLRHTVVGLAVFAALILATWGLFQRVPGGFIPSEDQGYVMVGAVLPEGASLERNDALVADIEKQLIADPAVDRVVLLGGMNMLAGGTNSTNGSTLFVILKPWAERAKPIDGKDAGVRALLMRTYFAFKDDPRGLVLPFNPPPVIGLGARVGVEFQLQDQGNHGLAALAEAGSKLSDLLAKRPEASSPNISYSFTQPLLRVSVDPERAKAMGLNIADIYAALQTQLGSLYVNDFTKFGRVWKVQLQAEPAFRTSAEAIDRMYVRNANGDLLPLSAVVTREWLPGPNMVTRFNSFPAVQFTVGTGAGYSTGQTMQAVEETMKELPPGFALAWSGASLQERQAGSQLAPILIMGLLVVFLILAAQYESVRLPFAVVLAVPLGLFGALAACWLVGLDLNIYVQIGLLVLVGLACKNAILIVEFAAEQSRAGKNPIEAAEIAAKLRFRPILMTSLAFILGVVPLILSSGAGAAGRISIGIGVFGGMLAATVLAVFLVPLFYRLIVRK
ncbi:MAG TPA: hydrophobe/amphiphile efflux-1 family RND transporter [Planctomycetes bacterium]|nr:hydrophobe/amphiphile efflux-1 family RND transporter [Planctomycetota bacterium]